MNCASSTDIYTLPCVRQTDSRNLLYRSGGSAPCSVMAWEVGCGAWEEGQEGGDIYVY